VVLGRIQHTGWIRDKEDIKIKTELMAGLGSVLHRMPELAIRVELEDNIYQKILIKNFPNFRKVFLFLKHEIA
jgi:metal-dependent HD superfamily phosphatase/phosphodiesterase